MYMRSATLLECQWGKPMEFHLDIRRQHWNTPYQLWEIRKNYNLEGQGSGTRGWNRSSVTKSPSPAWGIQEEPEETQGNSWVEQTSSSQKHLLPVAGITNSQSTEHQDLDWQGLIKDLCTCMISWTALQASSLLAAMVTSFLVGPRARTTRAGKSVLWGKQSGGHTSLLHPGNAGKSSL